MYAFSFNCIDIYLTWRRHVIALYFVSGPCHKFNAQQQFILLTRHYERDACAVSVSLCWTRCILSPTLFRHTLMTHSAHVSICLHCTTKAITSQYRISWLFLVHCSCLCHDTLVNARKPIWYSGMLHNELHVKIPGYRHVISYLSRNTACTSDVAVE